MEKVLLKGAYELLVWKQDYCAPYDDWFHVPDHYPCILVWTDCEFGIDGEFVYMEDFMNYEKNITSM